MNLINLITYIVSIAFRDRVPATSKLFKILRSAKLRSTFYKSTKECYHSATSLIYVYDLTFNFFQDERNSLHTHAYICALIDNIHGHLCVRYVQF